MRSFLLFPIDKLQQLGTVSKLDFHRNLTGDKLFWYQK